MTDKDGLGRVFSSLFLLQRHSAGRINSPRGESGKLKKAANILVFGIPFSRPLWGHQAGTVFGLCGRFCPFARFVALATDTHCSCRERYRVLVTRPCLPVPICSK